MINDERIIKGRGMVLKKTIILAAILLTLETILNYGFQLFVAGEVDIMLACVSMIASFTALIIILIGEIGFRIKPEDERAELEKSQYYTRAFLVFINIVACAFCLEMVLHFNWWKTYPYGSKIYKYFINFYIEDVNAHNALGIILGPCWIYLLLQLKDKDLPLNAGVIDASNGEYWGKVFLNILKFAGICALYVVISISVSLIHESSIYIIGGSDILQLETILTFIYSGVLVFASYSLEYLIFSLTERRNEKANAKNRLSKLISVFFLLGMAGVLIARMTYGFQVMAKYAQIKSTINNYGESYEFIGLGICIAYAISELKGKTSIGVINSLKQLGYAQIVLRVVSIFTFNIASYASILLTIVSSEASSNIYVVRNMYLFFYVAIFLLIGIVNFVMTFRLYKQLRMEGLVKNAVLPFAVLIAYVVFVIVVLYFSHHETMLAFTVISCLVEALYIIPFIRIIRKLNNQPEMASMDN